MRYFFFSAVIGSLLLTACSNHAASPPPQPPPPAPPTQAAQPSQSPSSPPTAAPAGTQTGATQQTSPEQTSPAQTAPPPAGSDPSWPAEAASMEQQVLEAVNARRAAGAKCGGRSFKPAPPMTMHPALRSAARNHSLDMATRNYFDHVTPEGRTVDQRVQKVGFAGTLVGENIASGRDTAAGAVEQWMASPGHCTNIMRPDFRHLGVGYAARQGSRFTHYWTMVFGGGG
ncbi:CAP domain-containing protein [Polyangium aurulentum]|uniref:CAP domain-containing protein n=1 Tax=Polyangium aurulentum TaxID=2567896 RepID=UPI0010AE8F8D|nr:CAP domain-containing protein [Polyangium aurulentum]UQA60665.1 CAP domain-containing protein [Polyangium aurulentum]